MSREPLVSLKLDKFEGPLDLLLQLIDQEKLPITEVAIGQVTEQYLQALRTIEGGMHPEILADFLVMAARLLYLKSRALFPRMGLDAEEEGVALEDQLRLYQKFVEASKVIEKIFHPGSIHLRGRSSAGLVSRNMAKAGRPRRSLLLRTISSPSGCVRSCSRCSRGSSR